VAKEEPDFCAKSYAASEFLRSSGTDLLD
jgi:hypothetical protein